MKRRIQIEYTVFEQVDVDVPDDADERDGVKTLDSHPRISELNRTSIRVDARWASSNPDWAPGKPDEPPAEAWVLAHGHEWATDGKLVVRRDGPRPPRGKYNDWRVPPPELIGFFPARSSTHAEVTEGRVLPGTRWPEARSLALMSAGEVRYRGDAAFVYGGSDDVLPIAVFSLCVPDGEIPKGPAKLGDGPMVSP